MKDYQSIIQEERNNRIENNRIRKVLDNELLKIDLLNKIVDFHEKLRSDKMIFDEKELNIIIDKFFNFEVK